MQPNNETPSNLKTWDAFQVRKAAKAAGELPVVPVNSERLEAKLTESIREAQARTKSRSEADHEHGYPPRIRKPRAPKAPVEAKVSTLADVLRQAVALAVARRERVPRDVAVREQTLLEVLTDAMRGAQ